MGIEDTFKNLAKDVEDAAKGAADAATGGLNWDAVKNAGSGDAPQESGSSATIDWTPDPAQAETPAAGGDMDAAQATEAPAPEVAQAAEAPQASAAPAAHAAPHKPAPAPHHDQAPKHAAEKHEPRVYTVKSGDTLSAIGERFGVNWREIARVNKIPNPDLIYPGQKFIIPD